MLSFMKVQFIIRCKDTIQYSNLRRSNSETFFHPKPFLLFTAANFRYHHPTRSIGNALKLKMIPRGIAAQKTLIYSTLCEFFGVLIAFSKSNNFASTDGIKAEKHFPESTISLSLSDVRRTIGFISSWPLTLEEEKTVTECTNKGYKQAQRRKVGSCQGERWVVPSPVYHLKQKANLLVE